MRRKSYPQIYYVNIAAAYVLMLLSLEELIEFFYLFKTKLLF